MIVFLFFLPVFPMWDFAAESCMNKREYVVRNETCLSAASFIWSCDVGGQGEKAAQEQLQSPCSMLVPLNSAAGELCWPGPRKNLQFLWI